MKANEHLMSICSRDDVRLAKPFTHGNYTFFSDGSIVVRVDKINKVSFESEVKAELLPWPRKGEHSSFISPDKVQVGLQKCSKCSGTGKYSVCVECCGDGVVSWETDLNEYEAECLSCYGDGIVNGVDVVCKDCHGDGFVKEPPFAAFCVSGVWLSSHVAQKIQRLQGLKISETPTNKEMLYFRFDGGDGFAMAWSI